MTSTDTTAREVVSRDRVVIRFAGDSGDGMQLTGDRFTSETASFGNDLSTLPNFPAEIRAPAGTLPGVSSFQLHFAELRHPHPRRPPGRARRDEPRRAEGERRRPARAAAMLIVNTDEFTKRNLTKVGYTVSPLDDGSLERYTVHQVAMATLTRGALEETGLSARRTPSGRRTCSPWACCRGCTTGPPRARSGSCGRSSRSGPTSPRRTCWPSGRATPTARPPSRSP